MMGNQGRDGRQGSSRYFSEGREARQGSGRYFPEGREARRGSGRHFPEGREARQGVFGSFLAEQAVRLAGAAVFWCLAGLLAASAYSGYQKISAAAEIGAAVTAGEIQPGGGGDTPMGETEAPERKQVALTFDDGPHPVYTAMLLDGLKERGISATFFVVGKNISGNEELIARMEREGHLIGNHTYDHVKISDMEAADACAQVEKTSTLVREITGHDTEFVRPPFGAWKKGMECSFTMIPVLWDVDPLDWTTKDADLVVGRVLREVEPGDIILLHDSYESSVEAALRVADTLTEQGYEFVTADRLILE